MSFMNVPLEGVSPLPPLPPPPSRHSLRRNLLASSSTALSNFNKSIRHNLRKRAQSFRNLRSKIEKQNEIDVHLMVLSPPPSEAMGWR